ncbi:MAG TPA: GTPase HflX [Candidatus Ozemobacteraceae bacterium]|nr:GTPase HflX [Candidatus Ozemobacteraceae bacterium]
MTMTYPTSPDKPRIIAIAVQVPEQSDEELEDSLAELAELVKTAGGIVVGRVIQKRNRIDRSGYFGSGKLKEVADLIGKTEAVQVVADDELTSLQVRRLEEGIGCEVLDRTGLILNIFSAHASTREGKLQVELAAVHYSLLRLVGGYSALSRQRGGIGLKGPGETKIETDRRVLKMRLKRLNEELDKVVQDRDLQRSKRTDRYAPLFALVGYTNAGKSTLLNAMSGANVQVCDGLFTTLDPTARRVELTGGRWAILSDTVGFIRKLPHGLVRAFRATLESVRHSQVLIHVCDVSNVQARDHLAAVEQVLQEMKLEDPDRIIVFNKIDRGVPHNKETLSALFPGAIFLSARTGENLDELKQVMADKMAASFQVVELELPTNAPILKDIRLLGRILREEWGEGTIRLQADLPRKFLPRVAEFTTGNV